MNSVQVKNLENKVAWITGSSRGIGKAIAEHLASKGARVVIHGSRLDSPRVFGEGDSLTVISKELEKKYQIRALAVVGDLTDYNVVKEIESEINDKMGQIDILVNCAGGDIGSKGVQAEMAGKPEGNDALNISPLDIKTVMDRNFLTCVLCCKAVVPAMMERKRGKVVNIGSIAALTGIPGSTIYASAKAALHEYSRCLAVQLRPYDINVNVVAPGDTVTERFLASRETEDSRKVRSGTLERYGWPSEIASVVEFLVSDTSSYVSGEVIRVDGGSQCWPS
jgi:3-oxoacyl-[acyl-carrier protein] reductase